MTITVTLTQETETKLEALAGRSGKSVADCARELLEAGAEHIKAEDTPETDPVQNYLNALNRRTPEEIAEIQHHILAASTPRRTPPSGKTLEDMVFGKWPGSETDEEIKAALEEMS